MTVMKSYIFRGVAPYYPLKINGLYGFVSKKMELFRYKGYTTMESGNEVIATSAMNLMAVQH
jgi:hypothetical protein